MRNAILTVNHDSCPPLSSSGTGQWGESALKTSRLLGAPFLLARSWFYSPSAWRRRQPADTIQHSLEQPSRNRHLGQQKDQPPRVPHQTASHLDQLDLHAPQQPVLDHLGQTQPAREVPKVVRQDEQRQTHPVGHEPMARQPSPVQRVLALLDPLLGCPSTIVETHHSFGASCHVRDDEAHPREQLSPMPLHLGHHSPCTVPKFVV